MKHLIQIQKDLEKLQNQLVSMLAKFAIVFAGLGLVICLIAKYEGLLVFGIATLLIVSFGIFLFKKWYARYKVLRMNFFELDKVYKEHTNEHIKEAKEAMDGLLYIRRF
ncbi:hypothetical protein [Flavisolibacter tropicus]|uniref:Uncharacterized protein n=1 Tax=Flavisolibacter tropicus TaxID=1492898 RepID=A0A172TUC0_9BACT|nr:hypothetical protein [Flavisolibacter tropicus]ANE50474.1 hypothetical protein SY85_08180 [Flavisolibacter tropicus]